MVCRRWRGGTQSVLHRALTSTFRMGVNNFSSLTHHHQCLTSLRVLWLNGLIHTPTLPNLYRRVETVTAAKGTKLHITAHGFGIRCSTSTNGCGGQVSTNFRPYSIMLPSFYYVYYVEHHNISNSGNHMCGICGSETSKAPPTFVHMIKYCLRHHY